ncbi:hypothetical protein C8Q80DRAFT_1267288 [Daedaleopsis nitida]|nr:hypothetical protein C8Q80DRAFT_1267288 [Daedaleopsis nitida]
MPTVVAYMKWNSLLITDLTIGQPNASSTDHLHNASPVMDWLEDLDMDALKAMGYIPNVRCEWCRLAGIDGMLSPAPPAPEDHAPPANRETLLQREMMHCQQCDLSRAAGAKLFRCGGCRTELYCSKKCQREAWGTHKMKCKMNKEVDDLHPWSLDTMKALRDFSSKHGPSLADAAYAALNIFNEPERAFDRLLVVVVRPRPNSRRPETGFYCYAAEVYKHADVPFPPDQMAQMKLMLKTTNETRIQRGAAGTFLVMMHNMEGCMTNMVPFAFTVRGENPLPEDRRQTWRSELLRMLNNGIIQ